MGNDATTKATLTTEEAAKVLGISRGLAYAAAHEGQIPSIRVGKRLLVPTARLDAVLDGRETAA